MCFVRWRDNWSKEAKRCGRQLTLFKQLHKIFVCTLRDQKDTQGAIVFLSTVLAELRYEINEIIMHASIIVKFRKA